MERYHTGYICNDSAFIALGCLYLAACLDDLAERLRMDFHRCYTGSLCLFRSEDDFIGIASVVVTMVVAMTFVSMGIYLGCLSFMSVVMTGMCILAMVMIMAIVVVIMALVIMLVAFVIVSLVVVVMTMPFVIVGVSFVRMVVPFVVMIVAFVAMTRIA